MIHKNRANRRFVRRRAIDRKMTIDAFCKSHGETQQAALVVGKYAKGKVHCSCGLCSNKSGRLVVNRHSYPYHGVHNLSRRDKRAVEAENYEIEMLKQVS